jgi:hypothetical protein
VSDDSVAWLVQEGEDLLDVSSVGLYEFLELQTDPDVARRALDRVLASGGVELYEMRWPDPAHVRPIASFPADAWQKPGTDGTYVALDRKSGAPTPGSAAWGLA